MAMTTVTTMRIRATHIININKNNNPRNNDAGTMHGLYRVCVVVVCVSWHAQRAMLSAEGGITSNKLVCRVSAGNANNNRM